MDLEYKLITDKNQLINYKDDISNLFKHCFNREIEFKIWEWMYIANPLGSSIVSLCFDGELLVGHYGTIQIPIKVKGCNKKAILSVGSMVHSSYRKYGVFVKQGEDVYAYARGRFYCVMGFPNKMALPSRKKRLSWKIDESDYVALVTKEQLVMSQEYNEYINSEKDVELDVSDDAFLSWRLSKPGIKYVKHNSIIVKQYNDSEDIVFIQDGYENDLKKGGKYHILCDEKLKVFRDNKVFSYPFGYRVFDDSSVDVTFKKDLLISDVF